MSYPIMSPQALASWLRTKDSEEKYSFVNGHKCLLSQYLKSMGLPVTYVGGSMDGWEDNNDNMHWSLEFFNLSRKVALPAPRTFGAALARAEALK